MATSLLWASSPVDALCPAATNHLQCGPTQHMVQPTSAAHAEVPAHLLVPTPLRVHHPSLPCCCPLCHYHLLVAQWSFSAKSLLHSKEAPPLQATHLSVLPTAQVLDPLSLQPNPLWIFTFECYHLYFNCKSTLQASKHPFCIQKLLQAAPPASSLHSSTSTKLLSDPESINQASSRPRVKLRKHPYAFPLLCLTSLVMSAASSHPSHDGTQPKAQFNTDSLDFGVDNRCSAKHFKKSQRPPADTAPEQTFSNRVILNWTQDHST
jgi:hypothetical protein